MTKRKQSISKSLKATGKKDDKLSGAEPDFVGPSPNAATNLLIADVVLRAVTRIARNSVHKGVLSKNMDKQRATDIVENRTMTSTIVLYGLSKIATRSLPGALLVSGGLIAKAIYDRGGSHHKARRKGAKKLNKIAKR